jgi:chemotaxis protein CheX
MNATAAPAMDTLAHSDCVPESAVEIFQSICRMTIAPKEAARDDILRKSPSIVAVVSLVGDVSWGLHIGLPKETAAAVAERFAGFPIPFESNDICDAVGEIVNILAGDVKARLDPCGVKVNISLPSLMRCGEIEILLFHNAQSRNWCFDSEAGPFWVEINAGLSVVPTRASGA